jgi:hypothetical protein
MASSWPTSACSEISFIKEFDPQINGLKTLPHQYALKYKLSEYETFLLPSNASVLRQYIAITGVYPAAYIYSTILLMYISNPICGGRGEGVDIENIIGLL